MLACGLAPLVAHAQYEVDEQDTRLAARADRRARGARPRVPSWTDSGPGKLRYGGRSRDAGFEHVTRVELAKLAMQFGATLPWGIRAQAQANVQPDLADGYEPWLIEAILRKEWGGEESGWGLQAGLTSTSFLARARRPGLDAGVRALGVRAQQLAVGRHQPRGRRRRVVARRRDAARGSGIVVGAGFGPDQLGRLLALRGWVIGDGLSGLNSDLPLPNGTRTDIFDERDDRPAAYALVTLSDPGERGALKLGYFDNRGDQNADGSWHTQFTTIGVGPASAAEYRRRRAVSATARRWCATRPTTAPCARSTRCSRIDIVRTARPFATTSSVSTISMAAIRQRRTATASRPHTRSSGVCGIGLPSSTLGSTARAPAARRANARTTAGS